MIRKAWEWVRLTLFWNIYNNVYVDYDYPFQSKNANWYFVTCITATRKEKSRPDLCCVRKKMIRVKPVLDKPLWPPPSPNLCWLEVFSIATGRTQKQQFLPVRNREQTLHKISKAVFSILYKIVVISVEKTKFKIIPQNIVSLETHWNNSWKMWYLLQCFVVLLIQPQTFVL